MATLPRLFGRARPRSGRARAAVAAVAVAVAAAGIAVGLLVTRGSGPGPRPTVLSPAAAAANARTACRLAATLVGQVRANAAASTVEATADRARRAADAAAYSDPAWVPLDSGVQAVGQGLRTDNAALTRTGVEQLRTACAALHIDVLGST